jgi:hypothetical protein
MDSLIIASPSSGHMPSSSAAAQTRCPVSTANGVSWIFYFHLPGTVVIAALFILSLLDQASDPLLFFFQFVISYQQKDPSCMGDERELKI